jgi:hypothetical protein
MHIATLGDHLEKAYDENNNQIGYYIEQAAETNATSQVIDAGYNGFYIYVEIAPLLDAFGMQENILEYFVPAYMLFDVKLDIEIK